MTDKLTPEHRSWVMSRVRGRNTKPELVARSLLHRLGYRFTVNGPKNRKLPGKPDIVLPRRKTVVFVHGCFWHRHGCSLATTPQSNAAYWNSKFTRNVQRDAENLASLEALGWRTITLWECELKKDLPTVIARVVSALPRSENLDTPEELEDEQLVAETRAAYGKRRKNK